MAQAGAVLKILLLLAFFPSHLPSEEAVPRPGAQTQPADSFRHSGYVRTSLGGRLEPGSSISRQFDLGASGGLSPAVSDAWDLDLDLAVGYQSPLFIGLELGMGGGAGGSAADFATAVKAGYPGSERDYQ